MKIILNNLQREEILVYLRDKTYPSRLDTKSKKKEFRKLVGRFAICSQSNLLKFKLGLDQYARFFTSDEEHFKNDFITLQHVNNGHAGRDRLYHLLKSHAYGITRDEVLSIIGSCSICQSRRGMVTRPIIRPIIARSPRERYIADLIDFRYYSDVNDGYKWMLVVVDSFSKYMWTVSLKDKTSVAVVSAIKTIFSINGASFLLHTDNGREFCNNEMRSLLENFDVRHVRGRARCPWIQGQVERANQTIKWMIGSMLMSLDMLGKWTMLREDATHAYNTMRHSTTLKTPFELMFGPPIRQLMQEDQIESVLLHDVSEEPDIVVDI
ncbi:Pro-Pol polyprotein, partial [Nosema granulosis]